MTVVPSGLVYVIGTQLQESGTHFFQNDKRYVITFEAIQPNLLLNFTGNYIIYLRVKFIVVFYLNRW